MSDRWSNPSGGLGFDRFRVWPLGTDSYSHTDNANNWDTLDGILGNSASVNWPPTTGINGGIYAVIQNLQAQITTLTSHQPVLFGLYSALPLVGSTTTGTVYVATDTGGTFQMTGSSWILVAQRAVAMTPAAFATLVPYDGQQIDLVDSLTAATYRWRFVYNAGASGAYKWEFTGGSDLSVVADTITLPRGGNYNITWSAFYNGVQNGYAATTAFISSGAGTLSGGTALGSGGGTTAGGTGSMAANVSAQMQLVGASAGTMIAHTVPSAHNIQGNADTVSVPQWRIQPIRIS